MRLGFGHRIFTPAQASEMQTRPYEKYTYVYVKCMCVCSICLCANIYELKEKKKTEDVKFFRTIFRRVLVSRSGVSASNTKSRDL